MACSDSQATILVHLIKNFALMSNLEADHELGYQLMKRFAQLMLDRLKATRRQMLDVYANVRVKDAGGS